MFVSGFVSGFDALVNQSNTIRPTMRYGLADAYRALLVRIFEQISYIQPGQDQAGYIQALVTPSAMCKFRNGSLATKDALWSERPLSARKQL